VSRRVAAPLGRLAAHVPGVTAIESNARQYCPGANQPWEERFPGIFRITDGTMIRAALTGVGLADLMRRRFTAGPFRPI